MDPPTPNEPIPEYASVLAIGHFCLYLQLQVGHFCLSIKFALVIRLKVLKTQEKRWINKARPCIGVWVGQFFFCKFLTKELTNFILELHTWYRN